MAEPAPADSREPDFTRAESGARPKWLEDELFELRDDLKKVSSDNLSALTGRFERMLDDEISVHDGLVAKASTIVGIAGILFGLMASVVAFSLEKLSALPSNVRWVPSGLIVINVVVGVFCLFSLYRIFGVHRSVWFSRKSLLWGSNADTSEMLKMTMIDIWEVRLDLARVNETLGRHLSRGVLLLSWFVVVLALLVVFLLVSST